MNQKIRFKSINNSKKKRFLSLLFIISLFLGFYLYADHRQIEEDFDSVLDPIITDFTISDQGFSVNYFIPHGDSVNISIDAIGSYGSEIVSITENLFDGYGSFTIPYDVEEIVPFVFSGITVSMHGTIIAHHVEKSKEREIEFSVSLTQTADLNFTAIRRIIEDPYFETVTRCRFNTDFLDYNGTVSLSYDTYVEFSQWEIDTYLEDYPEVSTDPYKLKSYNGEQEYSSDIYFTNDSISYNLEIQSNITDWYGELFDYRLALEGTEAPAPMHYIKNIHVTIGDHEYDIDDTEVHVRLR